MFRRLWGSPRARGLGIAVVLAMLIAGAGGGAAIAHAEAQRKEIAAELAGAHQAAVDARKSAAESRRLERLAAAGLSGYLTELESVSLEQLAGIFGGRDVETLQAAIAAARAVLDDEASWTAPDVDNVEDWTAYREELDRIAESWGAVELELEQLRSRVRHAQADVTVALFAIGNKAPAAAAAVLAAVPLADELSKTAVTDTAAAIASARDQVPAIGAFLAAVDAVRAAQAAEEARLAAEAQANSGAGGSNRVPGGRGGGSSSSGGGAPSTGGGSTGGGTTPPQDTRRYADPRGPYTPGCTLAGLLYSHDPGPGGTSVISSVSTPYDYRIEGNFVKVYGCSSW